MLLIDAAQKDQTPTITSVVSESFPHLRRGAIRDFLNIMEGHGYFKAERWNKTDFIYTFETGSKIEFFSADQPSKVRGPRRDRLFINEANNIPYEAFDQLEVRTKDVIYLDWNPTVEFWYNTELSKRDDVDFLIVTYQDNEGLDPQIVASIEQRKGNKNWWRVYGLGLLGEVEGLIYTGWKVIDEVPEEAKLRRRWLDYGYTNDPTAIGDLYEWNNALVLDEQLYRKGMSNKAIADVLLALQDALVIADSSEPKSNDEIRSYGVSLVPAVKGQGSINTGIQLVQDKVIYVTKRSTNILKEQRGYLWMTDKDGKPMNVAQDWDNHHMDGIRYAVTSLNPLESLHEEEEFEEEKPLYPSIGI